MLLGALVLACVSCQTTRMTPREEVTARYEQAREFLKAGHTTTTMVIEKYNQPDEVVRPFRDGELWRYVWVDTVVVTALSDTPMAPAAGDILGETGYQHTVRRTTRMDLYFSTDGVLLDYGVTLNAR